MAKVQFFGNTRSSPVWMGDFASRDHILPVPARIDPAQFSDQLGAQITVDVAGAAGNATSIPVLALAPSTTAAATLISAGNVLIPSGTTLNFGGKKFATLTADAKAADTSLTVAAIPTALVSGDVASYSPFGTEFIPSGTAIGRTYAERDANTAYGPAAITDDEIWLIAYDVPDARNNPDCELYRHASLVKENFLPNYTTNSTAGNEVQLVAIGGTATAGSFKLGVTTSGGGLVWTDTIAWNATPATVITSINTALDDALGASKVVATDSGGTGANPNFKLTFSGTGYLGLAQPLVSVDTSALTGATAAVVTHSTSGGTPLLTKLRSLYRCIVGAA